MTLFAQEQPDYDDHKIKGFNVGLNMSEKREFVPDRFFAKYKGHD
ncbi:hypothetical protein LRHK_196 [Lacticaseibacillus rhamnosus ATCC 8530]|nr:hypothetical protein LRHK_196 [Lacticaseibacillus rhamnosus ATCC 8530]